MEAWGLYQRLHNRLAKDLDLTADLFRALVAGWSAEDVVDVLERMDVMRQVFDPPQTKAE